MMYEPGHHFQAQKKPQQLNRWRSSKNNSEHCDEALPMVDLDLSGLSLESLPNPTLNLASISHLDLSNNNLQVNGFLFIQEMIMSLLIGTT